MAALDGEEFGWNDDGNIDLDLDLGLDTIANTPQAEASPPQQAPAPQTPEIQPLQEVQKQLPVLQTILVEAEQKEPLKDQKPPPPTTTTKDDKPEIPTTLEPKDVPNNAAPKEEAAIVAPNNAQDDTVQNQDE